MTIDAALAPNRAVCAAAFIAVGENVTRVSVEDGVEATASSHMLNRVWAAEHGADLLAIGLDNVEKINAQIDAWIADTALPGSWLLHQYGWVELLADGVAFAAQNAEVLDRAGDRLRQLGEIDEWEWTDLMTGLRGFDEIDAKPWQDALSPFDGRLQTLKNLVNGAD